MRRARFFYLLLAGGWLLASCATPPTAADPLGAFPIQQILSIEQALSPRDQVSASQPKAAFERQTPSGEQVSSFIRGVSGDPFVPLWQDFEPGVAVLAAHVAEPRLNLWAVRADLSLSSLELVVNGKEAADQGFPPGSLPSTFVSSFVRDNRCIAGLNASPVDTVSGKEGETRAVIGITVSDGVVVAAPRSRYAALVFYKDGTGAIVNQGDIGSLEDIAHAVGGFYTVLSSGVLTERALSDAGAARHPRSAVGLAAHYLYLLVVDGRTRESVGATEAEVALLLRALGAVDGLNLDGGGSTALALTGSDGTVSVANTPVHNNIRGRERGVGPCIGIRRR